MNGAGGGETVQVQGGHFLRSTGRKDRYSKVYTARGPRDRRVRLSAHTAIQFYDMQDRLGYDQSSKAVDWLIKKAKNAIDKLTELPPWNPNDGTVVTTNIEPDQVSSAMALEQPSESSSGYEFQLKTLLGVDQRSNSEFIPPPAETECIADTMKSFFPTSSETSLMNFLNYPHDVITRASIHTADLDLSLHTLQEPISNNRPLTDQFRLSGSSPLTFDGENGDNRMGFILNSQSITQEAMFCQSSAVNPQTEALQSNFARLIRTWDNRSLPSEDNSLISTSHFISEFQAPARIESEDDPGI